MEGIVNDHAVEQHLVLDGRSPADVELSALVTRGHEARQRLQDLHQIRRATQAGDALDVGGLDGLDRHPNSVELLPTFGRDDGAFQFNQARLQRDVARDDPIVEHHHFSPVRLEFHRRHHQGVGSGRHLGQAVIALDVRRHPEGGALEDDSGEQDRRPILLGADKALHRSLRHSHAAERGQEQGHNSPAPHRTEAVDLPSLHGAKVGCEPPRHRRGTSCGCGPPTARWTVSPEADRRGWETRMASGAQGA